MRVLPPLLGLLDARRCIGLGPMVTSLAWCGLQERLLAALSLSEAERSMVSDQPGHLEGGRGGLLYQKAVEAEEGS